MADNKNSASNDFFDDQNGLDNTTEDVMNQMKDTANDIKDAPKKAKETIDKGKDAVNAVKDAPQKVKDTVEKGKKTVENVRKAPKKIANGTKKTANATKKTVKAIQKAVKMAVKATKAAVKTVKSLTKLLIKLVKILAALVKTLIAFIVACWPIILIALAAFAVVTIFWWLLDNDSTTDNKSLNHETSEYNETALDEDGNASITSISSSTKITEAFYQYFSEKSLWVVYEGTVYDDDKKKTDKEYGGVYEPIQYNSSEFNEKFKDSETGEVILKDKNEREKMFYINPNALFVFDKYLHKEQIRFPEQIVLPVQYEGNKDTIKNGERYKLKQLTDDDRRLIAKSQKYKTSTSEKDKKTVFVPDGNKKEKGVWDYGLGSILHYVKYIIKKENRGEYTAFEVWDPELESIDPATGLKTYGGVKKFSSYSSYENDPNKGRYKVTGIANKKGNDRKVTYTKKSPGFEQQLADEDTFFIDWVVTAAGDVTNDIAYNWKDTNEPFTHYETEEKKVTKKKQVIKTEETEESIVVKKGEQKSYYTEYKYNLPIKDGDKPVAVESSKITVNGSTAAGKKTYKCDNTPNAVPDPLTGAFTTHEHTDECDFEVKITYKKKCDKIEEEKEKISEKFNATVQGTKWVREPSYEGQPDLKNLSGKRYYEDYLSYYDTYVPYSVSGFFDYDTILKRININAQSENANKEIEKILEREQIAKDSVNNSESAPSVSSDTIYGEGSNEFEKLYNGSKREMIELIWDIIVSWGYSEEQAAAILGNLTQESSFEPDQINEIGCSGLVQWQKGRLAKLKTYAQHCGKDWTDVETQIKYLCMEIAPHGEKYKWVEKQWITRDHTDHDTFHNSSDVGAITEAFTRGIERPGGTSFPKRVKYAKSAYALLKGREVQYKVTKEEPTATTATESSDGDSLISKAGSVFKSIWGWVKSAMSTVRDNVAALFGKEDDYNILDETERYKWDKCAIQESDVDYVLASIFAYTDSVPISDFHGKIDEDFFKERYTNLFTNPLGKQWNDTSTSGGTSDQSGLYAQMQQSYYPDGFTRPLDKCVLSNKNTSEGVYLKSTKGEKVFAICDGTIKEVGNADKYGGDYIVIDNGHSLTYIGGLSDVTLKVGDAVKKGDAIGKAKGNEIFVGIKTPELQIVDPSFMFSTTTNATNLNIKFPTTGPFQNMPVIKQTDPAIKTHPYGPTTIGVGGCGISSFAMTLSALTGQVHSPAEMAETLAMLAKQHGQGYEYYYCKGAGSYHSIFPNLCKYYGLQIQDNFGTSASAIKAQLDKGRIVIISIKSNGISPYKGNGHFITIRGYQGDKFYVNDSAPAFNENTLYSYAQLGRISSSRAIWK